MRPLTYRVRSKFISVAFGDQLIGRITYRADVVGWCWSPHENVTSQPTPRLTWPDVIPDVEAWVEERYP